MKKKSPTSTGEGHNLRRLNIADRYLLRSFADRPKGSGLRQISWANPFEANPFGEIPKSILVLLVLTLVNEALAYHLHRFHPGG